MHQLEYLPCPSPALGREGGGDSEHVLSILAVPVLEQDSGTVGTSDLGKGVQVTGALAKRRKDPPACNESLLHPHLREVRTLDTLTPPFSL